MAKLYFYFGCVTSSKTLNLLSSNYNFVIQGKKTYLMKPKIDTRFGETVIKSKLGISENVNLIIEDDTDIFKEVENIRVDCIFVDEAQFLSEEHIDQLRKITIKLDIPVICYGLKTDFKSKLFTGSKRLIEIADSINEIKSTCHYCKSKSIMNLKHHGDTIVTDGPTIELGSEELYFSVCYKCYDEKTNL